MSTQYIGTYGASRKVQTDLFVSSNSLNCSVKCGDGAVMYISYIQKLFSYINNMLKINPVGYAGSIKFK